MSVSEGGDVLMFRHVVNSEQTILASTAKHSIEIEEEMTPSMSITLSGKEEEDSIKPWGKDLGAVNLI